MFVACLTLELDDNEDKLPHSYAPKLLMSLKSSSNEDMCFTEWFEFPTVVSGSLKMNSFKIIEIYGLFYLLHYFFWAHSRFLPPLYLNRF